MYVTHYWAWGTQTPWSWIVIEIGTSDAYPRLIETNHRLAIHMEAVLLSRITVHSVLVESVGRSRPPLVDGVGVLLGGTLSHYSLGHVHSTRSRGCCLCLKWSGLTQVRSLLVLLKYSTTTFRRSPPLIKGPHPSLSQWPMVTCLGHVTTLANDKAIHLVDNGWRFSNRMLCLECCKITLPYLGARC